MLILNIFLYGFIEYFLIYPIHISKNIENSPIYIIDSEWFSIYYAISFASIKVPIFNVYTMVL